MYNMAHFLNSLLVLLTFFFVDCHNIHSNLLSKRPKSCTESSLYHVPKRSIFVYRNVLVPKRPAPAVFMSRRVNAEALILITEYLTVFVSEAATRACKEAKKDYTDMVNISHFEKILPQLLLDFS